MLTSTTNPTRPSTRISSSDPLEARFGKGHRLPAEMTPEACGMEWRLFTAIYCPIGDVRITNLEAMERVGLTGIRYLAEITTTSKTHEAFLEEREIIATGPVQACTQLLAQHGRGLEILIFRQVELYHATATMIQARCYQRSEKTFWALGFGATPEASISAAMSSAAQRLHG